MSSLLVGFMESQRAALKAIRAHGMRSVLTALGIVIGVASVIAVVAIVQGLSASINSQFEGMGTNVLTVQPDTPLKAQLAGRFSRLTERDYQAIRYEIEGVSQVTATIMVTGRASSLSYQGRKAISRVIGTGYSYQDLYSVYPELGRFFTRADEQSRRRVAVLGASVVESLDIKGEPVGQYLQLGSEWFKIIGVMERRGDLFGLDQDDYVLLPYSTARALLGANREAGMSISLLVDDMAEMDRVKERIASLLRRLHDLKEDDRDDFSLRTAKQLQDTVGAITSTTTAVAAGVVGISLLVGGIGIMNIMLVSVTERTREIGILKALGATRGNILLQFLSEAVMLCLLGGLIGLALGYGVALFVSLMLPSLPAATVPVWAVALSLAFSVGVGVLFGILPAFKAANLHPIEALRYE
ncbi:ABC transporter permease [Gallaecimonas sp. GXIMD4217]|uniref:ABC transporter permease n=1 Tax=Gallaecimonas sp. GXIMD4217 TaxID=3131927 RepID=UPI00311ACAEF